MDLKPTSSEKITDQSSNQSSLSEKINFLEYPPKKLAENIKNKEKSNDIDYAAFMRKYSMEPQLFIKDFVPVIKPIEIHLVPSKFRLNEIEFKHARKNKNKKNSISCPCSEDEIDVNEELKFSDSSDEEDISDISNLSNHINKVENGLKEVRKNFFKIKSGAIHKVMTKKNYINKKKSNHFDCFNNSGIEEEISEKDKDDEKDKDKDDDSISSNLDLYDENNFTNYCMKPYENNEHNLKNIKSNSLGENKIDNLKNIINDDKNNNVKDNLGDINKQKRNRIHSFSILETLKNKLKMDK